MATGFQGSRQWSWYNFFICSLISLGQVAYGYPASIISTTLGQPAFLLYMGLVDKNGNSSANADTLIGAISGVFQAGAIIGVLICSWVTDKWGRKAGFIYSAVLGLIGGAGLTAAQNIGMFIAFRFFAGAGAWSFIVVTTLYCTELAPPKLRGFFVGMNGVTTGLGYTISSYMGLAFYSVKDNPAAQWRGPLGLALFFPFLMLAINLVVPESPRYLLLKGRVEEARAITMRLHYIKDDPNQEYAREEFYQMQKQAEFDRTLEPSWKEMFTNKAHRKRLTLGCGYAFMLQSTAVLVINNYGPLLYKSLGYGTRDQLALQCGFTTLAVPFNLIGAAFMDGLGRKILMVAGVGGCIVCLSLEAAMVASFASPIPEHPNYAGLRMGVAAIYMYMAIYSLGVDVAAYVFWGEIFPGHVRSKGVSLSIAALCATSLVYLEVTETAFNNIGWKFFLVFIIISAFSVVIIIVFFPETKGLPLEEMAALFGDAEAVMVYSQNIHLGANNQIEVEAGQTGHDEEKEVVTAHIVGK